MLLLLSITMIKDRLTTPLKHTFANSEILLLFFLVYT